MHPYLPVIIFVLAAVITGVLMKSLPPSTGTKPARSAANIRTESLMRRYLPAIIIVVAAVITGVLMKSLPPSTETEEGGGEHATAPAPAAAEAPKPLAPQPEYLKVGDAFMAAWAGGDARANHALLSARMQELAPEATWAQLMGEVKLSNPRAVAHTAAADAAYVIYRVDAPQPKGATPVNGYALLLKQENGQWRVALAMPEEKVAGKYADLKIAPGKDKGYEVTYQDETGQIATVTLQEL